MYYTCLFSLTFRGHRGQSQKIELVPLSPWKSFQIQNLIICHVFLFGVPMTLLLSFSFKSTREPMVPGPFHFIFQF